jgi:hypothetical protein
LDLDFLAAASVIAAMSLIAISSFLSRWETLNKNKNKRETSKSKARRRTRTKSETSKSKARTRTRTKEKLQNQKLNFFQSDIGNGLTNFWIHLTILHTDS